MGRKHRRSRNRATGLACQAVAPQCKTPNAQSAPHLKSNRPTAAGSTQSLRPALGQRFDGSDSSGWLLLAARLGARDHHSTNLIVTKSRKTKSLTLWMLLMTMDEFIAL